jgi:hypothetical protein
MVWKMIMGKQTNLSDLITVLGITCYLQNGDRKNHHATVILIHESNITNPFRSVFMEKHGLRDNNQHFMIIRNS